MVLVEPTTSVAMAQTLFNSTGNWTAFQQIGDSLDARAACLYRASATYLIQVRNTRTYGVIAEIRVSGVLTRDSAKRVNIDAQSVTVSIMTGQACFTAQSQDIFVTGKVIGSLPTAARLLGGSAGAPVTGREIRANGWWPVGTPSAPTR